jgi:soluble lytic murein transglycosylase
MIIKCVISISIIILAYSASCLADIYKYIDDNGVAHFTNDPGDGKYRKFMSEGSTSNTHTYDQIINRKSTKYNIEPAIIEAVITAESNWDPQARSKKGAIGLMQLMPATAKDMKVSDPYNPEDNIEGGTRYLRYLLNRFNDDLDLALAAYNAGPTRVEKAGGIPSIRETRMYVKSVKSFYQGYAGNKITSIYKVTFKDGTILYTNTPSTYDQNNLSKF